MRRAILGVLVLACATSGCGKAAPPAAVSAATVAGGTDEAQGAATPPQPAPERDATPAAASVPATRQPIVKSVNYEQLKTFLPEIAGWTAGIVRGEALTMPVAYSRAEARYQKGDGRIELEIIDTGMNPLLLAPLSMFVAAGYSERYEDGFKHASRFNGQPGAEDWNSRTRRGEVTAIAGNRFVVRATGHHLAGIETVRDAVEAVDLMRLSALR